MELDAGIGVVCSSGMTSHVNRAHHVTNITQVAKDLAEDEDWLRDIAIETEIEGGLICVYGLGEDGVQAFTDLRRMSRMIRPSRLRRMRSCR
ncbi:hypothetical protein ABIA06_005390 [Bradyrhizobium yuanmingense]|uniref:hypothetical protein n=1 Tax=Bradyrhizobium yuanmingense TaxID=108015 RepID=UPI00351630AB